jgi:hypothetical protein
MAGSPISQSAQYADDYLTRDILGPRVSFLIDAATLENSYPGGGVTAPAGLFWAMPTRGRIVKTKLITNTILASLGVLQVNTSLKSAYPAVIFNSVPVVSNGVAVSKVGDTIITLYPEDGSLGGANYAEDTVFRTWLVSSKSHTVTVTLASPGVFTWSGHALIAGTPIVFSTTGALPTGLVAGTMYYVSANSLGATFKIADTAVNAIAATDDTNSINTSVSQSGVHTAIAYPDATGGVARFEVTIRPTYN